MTGLLAHIELSSNGDDEGDASVGSYLVGSFWWLMFSNTHKVSLKYSLPQTRDLLNFFHFF